MLISHKHKYIFVKTGKVAGTSTEIFFEQMSFSKGQPQHSQSEIINEEGIVGHRGEIDHLEKPPTWLNHCKLKKIKKLLNNDDLFNEYFKFSITRNPWDRVVSAYHHFSSETSFKEYVVGGKKLVPIFRFFDEYIDDVHFIRFENLQKDVEYVCKKLGLDCDMNNFGTYKSNYRGNSKQGDKHYTEYYDEETKSLVAEKYAKDIEYFGYKFGE